MTDLAKFRAEIDMTGSGKLEINDQPVEHVVAFTIQSRLGSVPVVVIQQHTGSLAIEGEGIVQIPTGEADKRQAILDFLNHLDAEELEHAVLAQMGYGDAGTMATAIDILRRRVRESPPA